MAVVILSMHGSGSSLVASICDALGVNMNPNPKAKVKWYQNYEDTEFVKLNIQILKKCGGNWKNPPSIERIDGYVGCCFFGEKITKLVSKRSGLWGFKDPRTAITIPIIHSYLAEPKYIRVVRPNSDIANSIMSRGIPRGEKSRWISLAETYNQHIEHFLSSVDSEVLTVKFDSLLNRKTSSDAVQAIADFVDSKKVDKALKRINYERK